MRQITVGATGANIDLALTIMRIRLANGRLQSLVAAPAALTPPAPRPGPPPPPPRAEPPMRATPLQVRSPG